MVKRTNKQVRVCWLGCFLALLTAPFLAGCSDDSMENLIQTDTLLPLEIKSEINQDFVTRVNDNGFVNEDEMGVFIVDYKNGKPDGLRLKDNHVSNMCYTFDASDMKWVPMHEVFWTDANTPIDVYGYYPFDSKMSSVNEYPFEVHYDQRIPAKNGQLSTYEQSDLLWTKSVNIQPGQPVNLLYTHNLAGVKVVLEQGKGFEVDEWGNLSKLVTVDHTVRKSTIDLSTGIVTPNGTKDRSIFLAEEGNCYRGIVIPQVVEAGQSLIGITIDGKSYAHIKSEDMHFLQGRLHLFTIRVDKRKDSGDYDFKVVSESIEPWQNDESSHDFEMNSYVVVDVKKAGTLSQSLTEQGISASAVTNLKIKGQLTESDFDFIRNNLPKLSGLNLQEAKIVDCTIKYYEGTNTNEYYEREVVIEHMDNVLPAKALARTSIDKLVLPSGLKGVGMYSLEYVSLVTPLVFPDGFTHIYSHAMENLEAEIEFPQSLEFIGSYAMKRATLKFDFFLPNTLKYIGQYAFYEVKGMYGSFYLPAELQYLGRTVFSMTKNNFSEFTIEIPRKIKHIWGGMFSEVSNPRGAVLKIHDGVDYIGFGAFRRLKLAAPLELPDGIERIDESAFEYTQFVGNLVLPRNLNRLELRAFERSNLKEIDFASDFHNIPSECFQESAVEKVTIGDKIEQIEEDAFLNCVNLKTLSIGKFVDVIDFRAFAGCNHLKLITCMAFDPPTLGDKVFEDVDYERVILQVPEKAIKSYRNAKGWNNFKNITAYHELAFNHHSIAVLNKETTRKGMLMSEGEWYVESCPEWCEVYPKRGEQRKTELTIKFKALPLGVGAREGSIVFRLKNKDANVDCLLKQYDYDQMEDTEIVLQQATAEGEEIPIFIVGDGFDAELIQNGTYLKTIKQQMEYFFAIEPFKTYRDHFTVVTSIACSPDRSIQSYQSRVTNKFNTQIADGELFTDKEQLKRYAMKVSSHIKPETMSSTLFAVIANYSMFSGRTTYCDDGSAVSICALSDDAYPYDQRGMIQHELGGVGFGKLGNEKVKHFDFIQTCCCPICKNIEEYNFYKQKGYYENLTLSNKFEDLPWKHLFYHPKYSALVDIYEGAYNHARGVYRSELNSCMRSYIPYFNTISRESIVKRIMQYAGLPYRFEDFVAKDKIEQP